MIKEMEPSDLSSCFLPLNLQTFRHPRGSFFSLPVEKDRNSDPEPEHSPGSARPCFGSGTLFLVLHWEGVKGMILELDCLGSSPRSHSSLSKSLSSYMALNKSLHVLTSANKGSDCTSVPGLWQSLHRGRPTPTGTLRVSACFCFLTSTISTEDLQIPPLKTSSLPGPGSHSGLPHTLCFLTTILALTACEHCLSKYGDGPRVTLSKE